MLLLLLSLLAITPAPSQPPTFESLLVAKYPPNYYNEQAKAWRDYLATDCAEADDWYDYYKLASYANRFGGGTFDLAKIMDQARAALDPEGYPLKYLEFVADNDPDTRWLKLQSALDIDDDRPEAVTATIAYHVINGRHPQTKRAIERLHERGDIPTAVMDYNYNQLQSVAPNGVLLTAGDADTFPSWILQELFGVREDVLVINYWLMHGYASYREALFGQQIGPEEAMDRLVSDASRPFSFASSLSSTLDNLPAKNLYLVGLAYEYSTVPIDNLGRLHRLYTKDWRTEKLRYPFSDSPAQKVADELNGNYLPALLELSALNSRPGPIDTLIRQIAMRGGYEVPDRRESSAAKPEIVAISADLDAKDIDKMFWPIPAPGVSTKDIQKRRFEPVHYFQETEVSNRQFGIFLSDLAASGQQDLAGQLSPPFVAWQDTVDVVDASGSLSSTVLEYLFSPEDPIVNISHRAAAAYADWLTKRYNTDERAKRRVLFRLPTAKEFEYASRAGRTHASYPWGGPYIANSKGCFLANFDSDTYDAGDLKPCDSSDGGRFTVPVDSYFPNDYGLYNMSGNAAEMTATPGLTIGGSWADTAEELVNGVTKQRQLPSPTTGFRLIMEVVE